MNIKVCGITTMKQLQQLDGLNIDFAGMVFNKQSPQFVDGKISGKELKQADLDIKKVGVFVNASMDDILDKVEKYGLDMVQLEGEETPEFCESLSGEIEVIKTFFIDHLPDDTIDSLLVDYDEFCDYYSFDTIVKKDFGGISEKLDLQKITGSKIEKPFFLGGGIKPEDAQIIKQFRHPDFYGIDLNSYFEKDPGIKDMALVLGFVAALK